jgi:hypothetical protein
MKMGDQFLLRLSDYVSQQVGRAAEKLGVSKTKFIEELIQQEFAPGNVNITLLGPAGVSKVAWEFLDALRREKDRLAGVIRLDSSEASGGWHLLSYGLALKNDMIVYAAIGVISTGSREGALVYQAIEEALKKENISSIVLPGPILRQYLPNTPIEYVPMGALSRAFSWGKEVLTGGPKYTWQEEHTHEIQLDGQNYIIACRMDLPEPHKRKGYMDIWAFRKENWEREPQAARWMVATARTEVKCMLELDYDAKKAEVIDFLFSSSTYNRQNHWLTGLAQEVLDIMEEHCREFGVVNVFGDSTTFGHADEYKLHAAQVLELKGYAVKEQTFSKELDVTFGVE